MSERDEKTKMYAGLLTKSAFSFPPTELEYTSLKLENAELRKQNEQISLSLSICTASLEHHICQSCDHGDCVEARSFIAAYRANGCVPQDYFDLANKNAELRKQLAAAQKDTARLDWMAGKDRSFHQDEEGWTIYFDTAAIRNDQPFTFKGTLREAIDAAMPKAELSPDPAPEDPDALTGCGDDQIDPSVKEFSDTERLAFAMENLFIIRPQSADNYGRGGTVQIFDTPAALDAEMLAAGLSPKSQSVPEAEQQETVTMDELDGLFRRTLGECLSTKPLAMRNAQCAAIRAVLALAAGKKVVE